MKTTSLWLVRISGARAYGATAQVYFSTASDDISKATKKAKKLAVEVARQNGESTRNAKVSSIEFVDGLF